MATATIPGYNVEYLPDEAVDIKDTAQGQAAQKAGLGKAKPSSLSRISGDVQARRAASGTMGLKGAAKWLGKTGVAGAALGAVQTVYNTPTEQYAKRFGLDQNADRGLAGDIGLRTLGAASDVGNALTLGLAGKFYRDLQSQEGNGLVSDAVAKATPNTMMAQQPSGYGAKPAQTVSATQPAPTNAAPAVSAPATTETDAWLAERGVNPGMKDIGLGANRIYKTGSNSFVGVGPNGPSEAARQESFKAEQNNNLRNSLTQLARGGDDKAARTLAEMDAMESAKPINDINRQTAELGLAEERKRLSLRDQVMQGKTPEQQYQMAYGASRQPKGFAHATRKIYNSDGVEIGEEPVIYSQDTGQQVTNKNASGDVIAEARRALATGKITLAEINKRLAEAGYQPIKQ